MHNHLNTILFLSYTDMTYVLIFLISVLIIVISFLLYSMKVLKKRRNTLIKKNDMKLTESMQYAKKIQNALMPDIKEFKGLFKDYFIISKSLDIVSGDLHWFANADGKFFIAVMDCRGHGIPGAFLSMIGHTLLTRIILEEKEYDTGKILDKMRTSLYAILKKEILANMTEKLMHISLCKIDLEESGIYFSGADNPLYCYRENEFIELEGDESTIGYSDMAKTNVNFTTRHLDISDSTIIYLTTEGFYLDETRENKNVAALQTKNLIRNNVKHPFGLQKEEILKEMEKYDYKNLQTDDFTIIAIKIN